MNVWRMAVGSALALGALAAGAAAQGAKKADEKCNIDFAANGQIGGAHNAITLLQISKPKPDEAKKRLKTAVTTLTQRADFGKDQIARNFTLGQALLAWYELPDQPVVAKRGDIGYDQQKDGTVDLLAAADSAFTAVETANPDCESQTSVFRQQAWAKLINHVGPLINTDSVNAADSLLKRAMLAYKPSAFNYYFQGQIAQHRNEWTAASDSYVEAAKLAKADTAAKDSNTVAIREFCEFSAGYAALKAGQGMTGDEQKAQMKKAADLYRAYLADFPSGANSQPAQAGLTVALKASGDTASLGQLWSDMIANPSHYNEAQLYDAGTQAFTTNQYEKAVQLMELGEKQNPYLRAGLFNLANAYWKNNQYDKMLAVSDTLTKIDPDNPDNYQLAAIALQEIGKKSTDPKVRKAYADSVQSYLSASDKIPVRLTFNQFSRDGTKVTVAGDMENMGAAPKNGTLVMKFIDVTGQVLATQNVPVALGPKETKPFTVTADNDKIAAFRYDPIQ